MFVREIPITNDVVSDQPRKYFTTASVRECT